MCIGLRQERHRLKWVLHLEEIEYLCAKTFKHKSVIVLDRIVDHVGFGVLVI